MVAPLLPVPPTLPASPSGRRAGLRDGRVEDVCPTLLAPLRLHWCPPGGVGVSMAWLAVFADDTGREQVGVRRWRGTPSGLPRGRGWTLCAFAGASRGSKDPRGCRAPRELHTHASLPHNCDCCRVREVKVPERIDREHRLQGLHAGWAALSGG